jgi:hypothetical protein
VTDYLQVNEAQYTRAYWGQWPADEIYLDAQIRAQQFIRLLCPAPGDTFLDLGGGVGNFANRMCHSFTLSVLCDIAPTTLRQNTNPGLVNRSRRRRTAENGSSATRLCNRY